MRELARRCVQWIGAALTVLVITAGPAADASNTVRILVRSSVYRAPATVLINVRVTPDADNRFLRLEVDGELLFRASEIPLDGANAAAANWFEFRDLPAGHYQLRAELRSSQAVRAVAIQPVIVVGPGTE
jgi:hypothetical protein